MTNELTLHLSEPFFTCMKLGFTNILAGVSTAGFHNLLGGDVVTCTNDELGCERTFTIKITHVRMYDTIQSMILSEGVSNCLPGIDTIEQAIHYYHTIYTKTQIANFYAKAIEFIIVEEIHR
uniref:ASCH domain-containing protein n=1 Tax=viral metagenome TaxID=1070528 RepID=A0A6C0E2X5_9ZZZZ